MQQTFLGYRVEKTAFGYRLHGKRAVYSLRRTEPDPHTLFALNGNRNVTAIKGHWWFGDGSGELRPKSGGPRR